MKLLLLVLVLIVNAAETPRSVPEPAPIAWAATGIEQGANAPAAPERTPAPPGTGFPQPAVTATQPPVTRRTPASGAMPVLHGRASWYATAGSTAAAGPALRRALGPGWRGTWVRVSAGGRSVAVKLTDACQCYRGERTERVLDLSASDFAELAPLAAGLVVVRVSLFTLPATDR